MHSLYNFLTGPMVWIAFAVFVGGSLFRLISMIHSTWKKERFVFSYMSLKYGIRSIVHWITPFGTANMKLHPVMTVVTFLFHICILVLPVFLLSHIVLVEESWGVKWPALPDGLADIMTVAVIGCCVFFLVRRIKIPEVRYVTSASDYALLAIAALPFVTGLWAYHQWPGYSFVMILHILSGEIMLMAIPFTRLSHMIYAVFTRAYLGSEFGSVRKAIDW